ncbi:hypothetical protein KL86DES1_21104 [uncultured Desulfovibrio sp.]|uniref:Uncharacterized protein n=1 Tax=uncultured Desulfovibrio sp. TaxID=167968 RepID=A0A212L6N1_9BACT|nr:hypothetical protein KL86DES1_21104 [uncultured Desulfovibrio sp.]VZH34002.1 conserved protein of unknown function [Desulfovibrio sp. 86]
MSESAEGARLLSEYTGLNLYREFKSLPLRHIASKTAKLSDDNLAVFAFKKGMFLASTRPYPYRCPYFVLMFYEKNSACRRYSLWARRCV